MIVLGAPVEVLVADVDEFRIMLRAWLAEHGDEFMASPDVSGEERFASDQALSSTMWQTGWKRIGWPELVGGLGGGPRHRATYYDELCRAGVEFPDTDLALEVLGPVLLRLAPVLAEEYLPAFLSGDEAWVQAFCEPVTGDGQPSPRERRPFGSGEILVDRQKAWSSHGHLAARMVAVVPAGTDPSGQPGVVALLIDSETPGVTHHPLKFASGARELYETFFDGVRVPADRVVGAASSGREVAIAMLQEERGVFAAQRQAWLELRLRQIVAYLAKTGVDADTAAAAGVAWLSVQALRARTIECVRLLNAGKAIGPEAAADKILLAEAERSVFELARNAEQAGFAFDSSAGPWRAGWWHSRVTSVFGGAEEIHRSIVADRVLRLPR